MWSQEGKLGRCWIGRLPFRGDLLLSLEKFAADNDIQSAWVEVVGAVEKTVFAFYEQQKRKYKTFEVDEAMEILSCTGNISMRQGKYFAHLHITLGDGEGNVKGGHLQQGTVIFAGEFFLREIKGPKLDRSYDSDTGLFLWERHEKA